MSVSYDNNNDWLDLINKSGNAPFLGNVATRWNVLNDCGNRIKISLCRSKVFSSLICSVLLFIFLLLILLCSKRLYGKNFIVFFLPFIWLLAGSFWGCRRSLLWNKGDNEIKLVRGIFPMHETFFLDKNKFSAKLEWSDQSKTSVSIQLYNRECSDSRVNLITSVRRSWIIPVFNQLKEILGSSCLDETC